MTSGPKRSRSILGELLQSPLAFSGRRRDHPSPPSATAPAPAGKGADAAAAAAAPTAYCASAAPLSPAPTPLSLQPGPVTTFLSSEEGREGGSPLESAAALAAAAGVAAATLDGRPKQPQARRAAGRPVGHQGAALVQLEEAPGQVVPAVGWMRSAAFKPR